MGRERENSQITNTGDKRGFMAIEPLDIQCKIRKKLETKTQILYTHEFNNIPEIIKIRMINGPPK